MVKEGDVLLDRLMQVGFLVDGVGVPVFVV